MSSTGLPVAARPSSGVSPAWFDALATRLALVVFGVSLAIALTLSATKPIAHAHSYSLGVRVTAIVAFIWYVSRYQQSWLDRPKVLWGLFVGGFYFVVQRPLTVNPDSEILAAYASAFRALDAGENPYACGSIVHFAEHGVHKLGNFNYPPLELWPYYFVARALGRWDHVVLATTLACLQIAACGVFLLTFARSPSAPSGSTARTTRLQILACVPFLAFYELYTNVALTMLFVALIVLVLVRSLDAPTGWQRPALWVLFGSGLMTKFLIVPLFATYVWNRLDLRSVRSWLQAGVDFAAPLLIAMVWMSPFGIANVFRETVLFNLVLRDRAQLTTFYPNVLSGVLAWLGLSETFSVLAVIGLGVAIVMTRWLSPLRAFLAAAIAFLLVSPTPEPQYVPVVAYLAMAAVLQERKTIRD